MITYSSNLTDSEVNELFKTASAARKLLSQCGFYEIRDGGEFSHWKRSFRNASVVVHSMGRCELDPASVCTQGISISVHGDFAFDDEDVVWSDESFGYEYLAPRIVEAVCKAMEEGGKK